MPTPPPPVAEQDDARFRLAMASAGIGMAIVSLDGRWVDVNPALCRMFDRAAAELVGRRVHALSHPDDLPLTERLFERLHGGEVAALDAEKRYLRRDGTTIDVLLNTALMRAADGAPLYFISQFREVTATSVFSATSNSTSAGTSSAATSGNVNTSSPPPSGTSTSTAGSASSSATSDTAQIPNPWTGCTTLADAAALTGYDFTVPDSVDGYPDVTIAVLESEQLTEVQYSSGNARLCLRKAPGSDDISGDFNQYAESNAVDVDGRSVTLQGNDGQVQLATWLDGDYTYSIGIYREDGTGLTADEMTGLVKAAK